MDVMLEVVAGGGSTGGRRWPCRLDVGPGDTGTDLVGWLDTHVARAGVVVGEDWRWWAPDGRPLETRSRADSVLDAGDTLVLAPEAPRRRQSRIELVLVAGSERRRLATLDVGIHRIGGSVDDDVTVTGFGLPSAAGVVEVHPDGVVDVRRDATVAGGDEDEFFGSPTAGRSIRFSASDLEADAATFRLGPVEFAMRRVGSPTSDGIRRERSAVNRIPYRPVREGPRVLDEVPAPPTAPRPSRMAITSFVVPLVSGIGMAVLLGRMHFLLIVLLAPIALAAVHAVQRRRGRRTFAVERADYRALVGETADRVRVAAADARADAHVALPAAPACLAAVLDGHPTLWQRAAGGPHLLRARVGLADRPAVVAVPIATGGDDALRAEAAATLAEAGRPPGSVPADVDLDTAVAVGICGPGEETVGLVRSMVAQFATHHGPEDVAMAATLSAHALGALDGLGWLPHTRTEASPVSGPHVAVWDDDVDRLVGTLIEAAARRTAPGVRATHVPRVLLVVDQASPVDRGALGQLLELAPAAGIRVMWFGDDPTLVPRQCRITIHVAGGPVSCRIESTDPDVEPEHCTVETLDREPFADLCRALAPCHDAASPVRAGTLPSEVTLADVVGAGASSTAWAASDGSSLAAPVGIGSSGPVVLDLVDHGPHALVAGTSGSGKSEFLQTWVAAMAAHHPPERCTFLFVDYKGAATAAPFVDLPHTVGSVSNLDPRLSQRALVSLRAELDRRMSLLEGRAKDLAEFASVAPSDCPPRLVIVIDEFATLAKEIPDFIAGVVDIAQRGRSLGIHLVLATQRPAGAVNDAILANMPLRIALRVVDGADSRSVLETEDAAAISPALRGRAFVKLGRGTISSVQVAWSSAPVGGGGRRSVVHRSTVTPPPVGDRSDDGRTQLSELVEMIIGLHAAGRGAKPRRAWVPELPPVVSLAAVRAGRPVETRDDPGREVVIGLADDPARQRRHSAVVDLEATGGLVVFGAGGSGRTTALRTAVVSAVDGASAEQVQVVALDFAGRALVAMLDLPQVRSVVTGDDVEGVAREIEWLDAEIDRRRDLLGQARAEAWSAMADRSDRPPRLLVVIDGFAGVRGALDSPGGHLWWKRLLRVLVDGRQVGIHALLAADRRNDLSTDVLGAAGARLVLRMADPEAMMTLGVPRTVARSAELPVGRGFLGGTEVQVAVLDPGGDGGPTGMGEAAALAEVAARSPRPRAPRAPGLPRLLHAWPDGLVPVGDALASPIGVDEQGTVIRLPLRGPALVTGPHGSGRTNMLGLVVDHAVAAVGAGHLDRIVVVADDRSPLSGLCVERNGVVVATDPTSAADLLSAVIDAGSGDRALFVMDDAERLDAPPLSGVVADWLDHGHASVVSAERSAIGRSLTGLLGLLRRARQMVVLQPDGAADLEALIGRRVRFRPGTTFPTGRAVICSRQAQTIVQTRYVKEHEMY